MTCASIQTRDLVRVRCLSEQKNLSAGKCNREAMVMLHNEHRAISKKNVLSTALLGFAVIVLSNCGFPGASNAPSAIGTLVPRPPDRIVNPTCGPAVGTIISGYDVNIPRDISSIVDFAPLLPASVPAPLTWSMAVLVGRTGTSGPVPLFHAAYGIWIEQPSYTYGLRTAVALDESATEFDPTADLTADGGSLRVTDQAASRVNGLPAVLYTLETPASASSGGPATRIHALMWHDAGLTLRLSTVEIGAYSLFPSDDGGDMDRVEAWAEGGDAALLSQLAQQVARYTGCGAI
jgi:hypothetical protein